VNFSGGDFAFLESIPFLAVLFALAVLAYAVRLPPPALAAAAVALGALVFAGSLTEGGREGWVGLPLGAACAALAWYASARFFARARARLGGRSPFLSPEPSGSERSAVVKERGSVPLWFLAAYGDLIALSLAVVSVVIPPLAFGALGAFVLLLVRGRAADDQKYEGLRILR